MGLNLRIVVFALVAVLGLIFSSVHAAASKRVVTGYLSHGADEHGFMCINLTPDMINGTFTHVVFSSLTLDGFNVDTLSFDDLMSLTDLNDQKTKIGFKLLFSLSSAVVPTYSWSSMVRDESYRSQFISSFMNFTRLHNFDGIDLDWNTVNEDNDYGGMENYGKLLQEMRQSIDSETIPSGKSKLLFTVTIPGGPRINNYNVTLIAEQADWMNVKTFDMIPDLGSPAVTAHHSQLKGNSTNEYTVDWTISQLLEKGVSRKKLVMGLAPYGRGFELSDSDFHGVGDAVEGTISGACAISDAVFWGTIPFYELQGFLDSGDFTAAVDNSTSPNSNYAYGKSQWFSYDNATTISAKVDYILEKQLLGAFVWTLDQDLETENNLASIPISEILPNSDGFDDETSSAIHVVPHSCMILLTILALMLLAF